MSTTTILLIAVPILVVLAGLLVFATARRRDSAMATGMLSSETKARDRGPVQPTAEAEEEHPVTGREMELAARQEYRTPVARWGRDKEPPAPPVAWVPPDEEALGVSRRQFLNRGSVTLMGLSLSAFGAASIGFLWPGTVAGFGASINLGSFDDLNSRIGEGEGFAYFPEARAWVTNYPSSALEAARGVYTAQELNGMDAGFIALYQKCPHLGCRVPNCVTSQWFECPCHGSQYNRVGEKKAGPAPRGMDRFAMSVESDSLIVDTGTVIEGPSIGTNTTGQEAEGPHCV